MSTQNPAPRDETLLAASDPIEMLRLVSAPLSVRYLAAFIMTALVAAMTVGLDREVTIPNLSLLYVLPVVIAAVVFGLGPSLFSAVLGALAYNFLLTEPRYTLMVDDPANIWAIGLLFVVGCIASAVASTARREADDTARLNRQMLTLQDYAREVADAGDEKAVASAAASALEALFRAPAIVILMSDAQADCVEKRGGIAPVEAEMEAARSSLTTGEPATAGIYPFDDSRFDFWPVRTLAGRQAVIGLAFNPLDRPGAPGVLVEIVGRTLGLALETLHRCTASRPER